MKAGGDGFQQHCVGRVAYDDTLRSCLEKVPLCNTKGNYHEVVHGHKSRVQNVDCAGRNRAAGVDAETRRRHTMNILLWVLQGLAAIVYGASGVMKVFMFDKVREGVPSFGALPRGAWKALGIVELVCTVGLIVPAALHWQPALTVVAATVLTMESVVFVWVHAKYREITTIILSGALGLLMAFIVYGRMVLKPIF